MTENCVSLNYSACAMQISVRLRPSANSAIEVRTWYLPAVHEAVKA